MKSIKIYKAIFNLSWKQTVDYRFNFFFEFICTFIPVIPLIFLWNTVYASELEIGSYSNTMMITYLIAAKFLNMIIAPDFFFIVTEEIQNGQLSNYLIKPINYISMCFYRALGDKSQTVLFNLIPFSLLIWLFRNHISFAFSFENLFMFVIAAILAYMMYFLIFLILAFISFWAFDISSWYYTLSFIMEFLAGTLVPLSLLPYSIISISRVLPFQYLVYFPINIIIGALEHNEIIQGIKFQLLWTILLSILLYIIWAKGKKQYDARGG